MSVTGDLRCGDELDPNGREVGPLEALLQDVYHWMGTVPGTLVLDPDWGFGIQVYLSRPLPATLADDLASGIRRDFAGRASDARVTITPIEGLGAGQGFRVDVQIEVDASFVAAAGVLNLAATLTNGRLRRAA